MTTAPMTLDLRLTQRIRLDLIDPNPWQPRVRLTEIEELAQDIKARGVDQMYWVRPSPDSPGRYQQAFGHRRHAAIMLLGVVDADIEVRDATDMQMAVVALLENKRRVDLSPMETFRAWAKMRELDGMTVVKLAETVGLDRSTVSNDLRLLDLPDYVQDLIESGEMHPRTGRELLCLRGDDGHYHDDIAREVIRRCGTGTPDWRAIRVRAEIADVVRTSSVSEWRKLFEGMAGGGHSDDPLFDTSAFKQANAEYVHILPNDNEFEYLEGHYQLVKTKEGGSRHWTCATSAWVKAQKAGKTAVQQVATAAASATTSTTGEGKKAPAKWAATLAQDPVFKAVTPETDGPLAQAMSEEERAASAAAQLGTRATPGILDKSKTVFKAHMGGTGDNVNEERFGMTPVPSYFPNIQECRTLCTWGAQYLAENASSPAYLFCVNREHFDEKLAAGRATVERKVAAEVRAIEVSDDVLYGIIDASGFVDGLSEPMVRFLAASTVRYVQPKAVEPQLKDWREARELAQWTANAAAIKALLGEGQRLDALDNLSLEQMRDLLIRVLIQQGHDAAMQPFVGSLVKATTEPALPVSAPAEKAEDGLDQE